MDEDLRALDWKQNNEHDRVDNLLLFSLKRGAVSFLVTEDRGIHKKAISAGLSDRVFFVEDFVAYLRNAKGSVVNSTLVTYDQVKCKYLYEVDVENVFFDSLRQGYDGFNSWYRKCSEQGRQAWIIQSGDVISALCIFKEEYDERVTSSNEILRGRILKLCTFKVADLGKNTGNACCLLHLIEQWKIVLIMYICKFVKRGRDIWCRCLWILALRKLVSTMTILHM